MYTFVKHNGGWWLKVSSIEEYMEAKLFENEKWLEAADQLGDYRRNKHFHFTNPIASLIYDFRCPKSGHGIIKGTQELIEEISSKQIEMLQKYGAIFINKNGGYCFGFNDDEKVIRDELIYPDDDYFHVDIKKWPYGSHYYLYINGRQMKDEFGNVKWNTYERVRSIANDYIRKNSKDNQEEK